MKCGGYITSTGCVAKTNRNTKWPLQASPKQRPSRELQMCCRAAAVTPAEVKERRKGDGEGAWLSPLGASTTQAGFRGSVLLLKFPVLVAALTQELKFQ